MNDSGPLLVESQSHRCAADHDKSQSPAIVSRAGILTKVKELERRCVFAAG
jgi:hypothetical protein